MDTTNIQKYILIAKENTRPLGKINKVNSYGFFLHKFAIMDGPYEFQKILLILKYQSVYMVFTT